ncbi:type II toxin-antitoxin system HicB family antitoxin [Pontibacter diazotrophicus]|uniref:Type II toxin-antitoxin system HicB family antitoxin n=1 Tax=Pontibacter diazotrophicus TaxID=1400979 RepID=A0A3D8L169_9BACT|nr:type II toxin-antitoxin system HicB family antitoxin [Pontibacter diazotrophicus]RDV11115.1 type II toxin-antitoxin system HicB family antitoxin [Pontibacter diazotrophicus]
MSSTIKYKDYIGSVEYSAEDKVFFGKIEFINDVVTFEGTTVEELEQAFQDSVDDYLEMCREIGKEPEKAFKGTFNIRMQPELHKEAARLSIVQGKNLNQLVVEAVSQYIHHAHQHKQHA